MRVLGLITLMVGCSSSSGGDLFRKDGADAGAGGQRASVEANGGAPSSAGGTSGSGGVATGGAATAGCEKDTDCKGERICVAGACVDAGAGGSTGSGGAAGAGGLPATGGTGGSGETGSGGSDAGDGGQANGGTFNATGGAATGGFSSGTGGVLAAGGSSSGTGGVFAAGGSSSGTGGASATGGVSGTGGSPEGGSSNGRVAVYLMLDQTGSMLDTAASSGGADKWSVMVSGVTSFVSSASSDNLDVAVGFLPALSGHSSSCDGSGYDNPEVPLGALPTNAAKINSELAGSLPTGLASPMSGALAGADKFCQTYQASHSNEKCFAVLVTDGLPNSCDTTSAGLTKIASDAKKNGVGTFVIGLKGSADSDGLTLLDAIATAGGTEVFEAGNAGEVTAALDSIRTQITPP